MPCSDTHFVPILDEIRAQDTDNPPPEPKPRNWGGRRPGSGAPKGNLNALKHGRSSRYYKELIETLADIPEARDALISIARRQQRMKKKAEAGASALLSQLLERVGDIVLNPESNQIKSNLGNRSLPRTEPPEFCEKREIQSNFRRQKRNPIKRTTGRRGDPCGRPGRGA
ncbi:MAG: hypothetical protein IH957_10670 [Chloroflexi bacterium]|nr:hypothetical protein [Chloroflexota bacterium]